MRTTARILVLVAICVIVGGGGIAWAQGSSPSPSHGPRVLPPPITLPPALGGRTISSAERDHPHSGPSHMDRQHPMETGHRIGATRPAAPAPRRSDDHPALAMRSTSILRLLGLVDAPLLQPQEQPSEQYQTICVIGAVGGPNDNAPIFQGMIGEGWLGCSSTAGWVYYTYQELNLFRCWHSWAGWCLPFQDSYVVNLAIAEARFTEQIKWVGPATNHSNGPGEYYVRNDGWVQAPSGQAGDYIDSALFWLN